LQTLKGNYGFRGDGTFIGVGLLSAVGLQSFDGQGNAQGSETANLNGFPTHSTFAGNYTVNDDCTGTITETFDNGFSGTFDIVIVDNGKEIFAIASAPPGGVFTAVYKRL
jgi:hypothetical protein